MPRCNECLTKNKRGRYDRANLKRNAGYDSHRNDNGQRYKTTAEAHVALCYYCKDLFISYVKRQSRSVCNKCTNKWIEDKRTKNLERTKAAYWRNPVEAKRHRLSVYLSKAGLSIEWYDAQGDKCGICKQQKALFIDHDHRCCGYGPRKGCAKCIRGLLCHHCNAGIGHFFDNPELLIAAIQWLSRTSPPGLTG